MGPNTAETYSPTALTARRRSPSYAAPLPNGTMPGKRPVTGVGMTELVSMNPTALPRPVNRRSLATTTSLSNLTLFTVANVDLSGGARRWLVQKRRPFSDVRSNEQLAASRLPTRLIPPANLLQQPTPRPLRMERGHALERATSPPCRAAGADGARARRSANASLHTLFWP